MSFFSRLPVSLVRSLIVCSICLLFFLSANSLSVARANGASITLSPTFGPPSSSVLVRGTGFWKETVEITFDSVHVAFTSSLNGAISKTIIVPASATIGNHIVQAEGMDSGLIASATFHVQIDWAMEGYDPQHTHQNPFETILSPSTVSRLTLDWTYNVGNWPDGDPAIVNGVAYVGSSDLHAVNVTTGTKLWSYTTGGSIHSSPAVANGIVYYVGSWNYKVYALNASTGALLWSYTTGSTIESSPTVVNGVVYIGSDDGILQALRASDGVLMWSYNLGVDNISTPAVDNGIVYVASEFNQAVYALNAISGTLLWKYHTMAPIPRSITATNGIVYVSDTTPNLYALSASTGNPLWIDPIGYGNVAVANGMVYISSGSNQIHTVLYAVNASTGAVSWTFTVPGSFFLDPAIANGVVYIGVWNHSVYAVNASTGASLWNYTIGDIPTTTPVVVNGMLFIGARDSKLYTFH